MNNSTQDQSNTRKVDDIITITICSQTMEDLHFKVKGGYKMKKIFEKYCQRMEIQDPETVRFVFEGDTIDQNQTVSQIGLADMDKIEAVQSQVGGYYL